MIQYLPIEQSRAAGEGLDFVQCIWVHGYDEGPGNAQGRGYGTALLAAAEADARARGAQGMAAWGMDFPHWFAVSWYVQQGYTRADQQGPEVLIWKPFAERAMPPRWIRLQKTPTPIRGKVKVTAFVHGWCPIGPANARIAKVAAARQAVAGLDDVVLEVIDTSDRATLLEWGIDQGIWIDDEPFRPYGPPFGVTELQQVIQRRLVQLEA